MLDRSPYPILGELHTSVQPVLSHLRRNQGTALAEEECHADIVAILAQNLTLISRQMIDFFAERFKTEPPTAVVYTVSCSGNFPSRELPHNPNLRHFMMDNAYAGIPQFAVKDAPYPQRADRELSLPHYGVILLENAFSYDFSSVIYSIHRAFDMTKDPRVLEATLHWLYRQSEYPPQGWGYRQVDALVARHRS